MIIFVRKQSHRFIALLAEEKIIFFRDFIVIDLYCGGDVLIIAEHVLQKIDIQTKQSVEHPNDIRNCHHDELQREDYLLTETAFVDVFKQISSLVAIFFLYLIAGFTISKCSSFFNVAVVLATPNAIVCGICGVALIYFVS